jgi:hypothetical protein
VALHARQRVPGIVLTGCGLDVPGAERSATREFSARLRVYPTSVDAENPMSRTGKESEMERYRMTALTAGVALAIVGACGTVAFAQTSKPALKTQAAPQNGGASMVKPPEAASGSGGASNPDNMPIKRPRKPTNDKMMHEPPASAANAK